MLLCAKTSIWMVCVCMFMCFVVIIIHAQSPRNFQSISTLYYIVNFSFIFRLFSVQQTPTSCIIVFDNINHSIYSDSLTGIEYLCAICSPNEQFLYCYLSAYDSHILLFRNGSFDKKNTTNSTILKFSSIDWNFDGF